MTEHFTPQLLLTILDNSLVNIYAAKALRDLTTEQVLDFQIYFCNAAFLKQVRLTQEQIDTGTLRSLFPVLEQSGFLARYKDVVETGEPFVGEQEYDGPNGHFWYQTTVKKHNDGIVVNFVDITGSKWAEQAVQQANDTLRAVLDGAQAGVLLFRSIRDKDTGTIQDFDTVTANETAARLIGHGRESIQGQRFLTLFSGKGGRGLFKLFKETIETGQPKRSEGLYSVNGINRWLQISASRQEDGFVLTFIDITDHRQNEQEAARQKNELRTVLDASVNNIFYMRAIRDSAMAQDTPAQITRAASGIF